MKKISFIFMAFVISFIFTVCENPFLKAGSSAERDNFVEDNKEFPVINVGIGGNGNVFINGIDTGINFQDVLNEIPPLEFTVGENGNIFVNGINTGINAQGEYTEPPVIKITIWINGNVFINGVDTGINVPTI